MFDRVRRVWWNLLLDAKGVDHGDLFSMARGCTIYRDPRGAISFGDRVNLAHNVYVSATGDSYIIVGSRVAIGPNTCIVGLNHSGFTEKKNVIIGCDVWIGANCVVLPGVTIGNGSVIGAGSVVTKDIPERVVAVGNPCTPIHTRRCCK